MRRGEIWLVDFEPARASEVNKTRPAVVVSNDAANGVTARLGRGTVTVVPITSNTRAIYPFQVLLPASDVGLRLNSKAQAEQIRAVSFQRLGECVGELTSTQLDAVDRALRVHLDL